jgi:hypothetical protein
VDLGGSVENGCVDAKLRLRHNIEILKTAVFLAFTALKHYD